MKTNKLKIIGFSEAVLTMIFDNLESQNTFPKIEIINNLKLKPKHEFINSSFDIQVLSEYNNDKTSFFLGVNKAAHKIKIVEDLKLQKENAITIIHKSAQISSTVKTGNGCMINSNVSIAGQTELGAYVTINRNASIGHHTKLDRFVTVNPGANIAGFVKIGKGTTIGMGANIIDGIEIGKNVIIGAGALVTKNIPDNVIAYGNPCKIIRDNIKAQ